MHKATNSKNMIYTSPMALSEYLRCCHSPLIKTSRTTTPSFVNILYIPPHTPRSPFAQQTTRVLRPAHAD
ncbi:hypothetical protein ABKN59_003925 [Abortiporus biennis]